LEGKEDELDEEDVFIDGICKECTEDCDECADGWAMKPDGETCVLKCEEFVETTEIVPGERYF
jgi:hypothetical protein